MFLDSGRTAITLHIGVFFAVIAVNKSWKSHFHATDLGRDIHHSKITLTLTQ